MKTDRFDAWTSHLIRFAVLGIGPLIVADEIVKTGRGPLGLLAAYYAGALVWAVTRRDP